jgi:Raf kinase inhibitor-like YbhB/YbcL family protein
VLILDDPDAPGGIFTHWLVYGIPGDRLELPAALPKAKEAAGGIRQGINDFGTVGYRGPCPPEGPPHRYVLTLYALDVMVTLEPGAERQALESAMKGHVLASAKITAVFGR